MSGMPAMNDAQKLEAINYAISVFDKGCTNTAMGLVDRPEGCEECVAGLLASIRCTLAGDVSTVWWATPDAEPKL